jgi:ABC-type Fe3+ transport system permease subunit
MLATAGMLDTWAMVAAEAAMMGKATRNARRRRRGRLMLNIKVLAWSLGLFLVVSYLLCVVYGLVVPESLHMYELLEGMLPGFRWLTLPGFLIGLVESFLYGVYGGMVFGFIHNLVWKRTVLGS